MIPIQDLLMDAGKLGPLPSSAARLARQARNANAHMDEVLASVRPDPDLTSRLFHFAHVEVAESGARFATDLQDVLLHLGLSRVFMTAVLQRVSILMRPALPAYGLAEGELLRHGLSSALAVQILECICPAVFPSATMAAALIHDIGKPLLEARAGNGHRALLARSHPNATRVFSQTETETFGTGHATIGARVAEHWQLGTEAVTAIRLHHEPGTMAGLAADAVRIGNLAARTIGCGLGTEGLSLAADASAFGRLGLTRHDFEYLCAELLARLPRFLEATQPDAQTQPACADLDVPDRTQRDDR